MNPDGGEPPRREGAQPVRTWPADRALADHECVELSCVGCRTCWRVHERMRGFRLRCACGAWLAIPSAPPALPTGSPAVLPDPRGPAAELRPARPVRRDGLVELPGDDGDVIYAEIPTDAPLAPGTLRRASASNQARWTNRTLLEFVLLMLALIGPQVAALLLAEQGESALLLPLTSVVSGALVALVLAWAGPYGRLGFRLPRLAHALEAVAAAAVAAGAALLYLELLEALLPAVEGDMGDVVGELGLWASLFTIAVTPAVLEEVIFRGMLQGRLMALMGHTTGFLVTAAAFAVVHGMPAVLPIHFGLGLYLGWLRERAGSLLPCMLMHFTYNGALVVVEFAAAGA